MSNQTEQHQRRTPQWTVAHRLEMAREDAELTQDELATLTGISRRTISTYEDPRHTGRRNPLYVNAIADACDVSREWVWTGVIDLDGPSGLPIAQNRCSVLYPDWPTIELLAG